MTRMTATVAASTHGSTRSISSYCASRAGPAPVTPVKVPGGEPRNRAA